MNTGGFDDDDDIWIAEDEVLHPSGDSPRRRRSRSPRAGRGDRQDRGDRADTDHRPGELGSVALRPSIRSEDLDSAPAAAPERPVAASAVDDATEATPAPEGGFGADHGGPDDLASHDPHDPHDEYDEYDGELVDEDDDTGPEKLPRWVLVLGAIALTVGLLVGGVVFWYQRQVNPPGGMGDPVELEIRRGTSASGLGNRLADHGIIRNGLLFNFWAGRNEVGIHGPGVYVFNENMSYEQAKQVLESEPHGELESHGGVVRVLIPEGLTIDQIVNRIADTVPRFELDEIEAALASGTVTSDLQPERSNSWEGLFFPATYDLAESKTVDDFLNDLTGEMERRVAALDPETSVTAINQRYGLDLGVYDVLTVASLVQSEAGGEGEAARIASVIYNRLEKDSTAWKLGIDAVDEYGADLEGMTPGEYRETDGAYNTRRFAGLPPTPISAPGDYALEAAFEPEDTEYMWYVLEAPGVHAFVVTDAEFKAAKARCEAAGLGCG